MISKPTTPESRKKTVLTLFGTRPDIIKLGPVLRELEQFPAFIRTINVCSGQHAELAYPLIELLGIRVDQDLKTGHSDQAGGEFCTKIIRELNSVVERERPDLILVQGDTTTALAGTLAGVRHGIPVGHVEAGLRSGDISSPYPEEINRQLISRLASYHFAATIHNREALLSEGISPNVVFVTGNPVVDAIQRVLRGEMQSARVAEIIKRTGGRRCLVLTTHRSESFGATLEANLRTMCKFLDAHKDVFLVFPVHPNPAVRSSAKKICSGNPRVLMIEPLNYDDFIVLLSKSWLIVSDSGGIQEEAPSLGKPLLILRKNTERPECIEAGVARQVGGNGETLIDLLEEAYSPGNWTGSVGQTHNPFGQGDSGKLIAQCIARIFREAPLGRNSEQLNRSQLEPDFSLDPAVVAVGG